MLQTTPLLDRVRSPYDVRELHDSKLPQLADELRQELIDIVSVTGGHFGAGLGAIFESGQVFSLSSVVTPEILGALFGLSILALLPVIIGKFKKEKN